MASELTNFKLPGHLASDVESILRTHGLARNSNGVVVQFNQKYQTIIKGTVYSKSECYECANCNNYFNNQTARTMKTIKNKRYCSSNCVHMAGYRYNPNYGEWQKNTKIGQVGKFDYKDSTPVANTSKEHPWIIGLEIEKEDSKFKNMLDDPKTGLKLPENWIAVHDGTLDQDTGFELVSYGYNLSREGDKMIKDLHSIEDLLKAKATGNCGGHISISELGLSSRDLAKDLRPLICLFLGLYPNRLTKEMVNMRTWNDCVVAQDKYSPVKLDRNGRIELRMIPSVKSLKQLLRRIKVIEWFLREKPTFKKNKTGNVK
jgi:hypothetical protein